MSNSGECLMMEKAIRVTDWIDSHRVLPTAEDVMRKFDVSRPTAYRWMTSYCDARGIARFRGGVYGQDKFEPVELPARQRPRPVWAGDGALRSATA